MILLLSSLHPDNEINKMENKPEIVLYYNKIKGANNTVDQLCYCKYRVNQMTFRWQIQIFRGMLDQAAVNNFVLSPEC